MSWIGWLILLTGFYLLLVLLRGTAQLVSWFVQEHILDPHRLRHPQERPSARPHKPTPTRDPPKPKTIPYRKGIASQPALVPAANPVPARKPSRVGRSLKSLKLRLARKSYDAWVASALAEEDPALKVEYLSKSLQLNPDYLPAWGLKANALFTLKRYDEAIVCFDKSLEAHPTALAWYKKGICCHHLGRREDALRCFGKALKTCPREEHQLRDDAARMKRLVEDEMPKA